MTVHQNAKTEPIAVIGSGCRFPGDSNSPSKLWELLRYPRDVLSTIPESRFNPEGFYHPDGLHHGTSNVKHSYLLTEDPFRFDAQFFGVKPVEANSMDPQQRLVLETVYEGLESAGLAVNKLHGSDTAVYVGVMGGDYADMLNRDPDAFPMYFATGTARSILSNRVSYFFDWHGPSMTIDTACSSSLVALHLAVRQLRSGESKVAVVAGANLILGPEPYIAESKLKMLSPTGRSQMWDEAANGYARGDGFASVVLKTLSAAIADGDQIECIIRETGINQDGRTKGITMPSPIAQEELIRQTYSRANLDINQPSDRPQYFEAHGTGTPAGDPIEAEAIHRAFFGDRRREHETLFVGSVKTVIGHTEGTAGLAAVLKASLAVQHGIIPPNLLFQSLNPAIAPFYGRLRIPLQALDWPDTNGAPRRVSVNSFGFGGANAHAIIEEYRPTIVSKNTGDTTVFTPFTFSAATERSLVATLKVLSSYLTTHPAINPGDLAWTLNSRRSVLPSRLTFAATSIPSLVSQLNAAVSASQSDSNKPNDTGGARSTSLPKPSFLGIFTGQGAQWAGMGRDLILASKFAREFIGRLEDRLALLPPADRPAWSLVRELLADSSASRLNEATLSQPLCTAIQLLVVELLRSAGIRFGAVVGHSSGEIAAAYAAGALATPEDAICIAYYRGLHSRLASGTNGQKGAMLAVGTSLDDAHELCGLPHFEGRISVAASNSSASVTLSGDEDAINEAKDVFEEEKKFARILRVDKAYHSHHMLRCSEAYLTSLASASIQPFKKPDSGTAWFSSVLVKQIRDTTDLSSTYWNDNMVQPVLFSQAMELAVTAGGPFDLAVEVGPHPALQGPVKQAIEAVSGTVIPYSGTLHRGSDDIDAMSNTLAYIWKNFGATAVDFSGYDRLISSGATRELLKGLPSYPWDHYRVFSHESRLSRAFRTRHESVHEILGIRSQDGTDNHLRWRNVLRPKEIPWLSGHQIQGQIVFPAAAYISAVIEAVRSIAAPDPLKFVELEDVVIGQAIAFNDEEASVETLLSLSDVSRNGNYASAAFSYYSAQGGTSTDFALNTSGRVHFEVGKPLVDDLPLRGPETFNFVDLSAERFYSFLDETGYGYSGPFRQLSALQRKLGTATGLLPRHTSSLLVHPASLDMAIQSILLAFCWPGDGRLWSVHVPTGIRRLRVNPSLWLADDNPESSLRFDATVTSSAQAAIQGDVEIFTSDSDRLILQLEGLHAKPFSDATSNNDFHLFSEVVWGNALPDGHAAAQDKRASLEAYDLAYAFERVAYYYFRHLDETIPSRLRKRLEPHQTSLFNYVDHVLSSVNNGKHQYIKKQWATDSQDQILDLIAQYPDSIDLRIMHAVGENLPNVIRGQTTILEHMMKDNMLNDYYINALGFREYTAYLARMVAQITNRYPHMNILEIGAGTGGATKSILKEIGTTYATYTFTDISSGFFENAQAVFEAHSSKMTFKTLNIENDPNSQGYTPHSYDLIIASLVLHATERLDQTLQNVRKILKPGGTLILLEITNNGPARLGFVFGGLPGWWLGRDDKRIFSPCITTPAWDEAFRRTGFSGVDTVTPDLDPLPYPLSVIVTQATDERVNFLRQPLSMPSPDIAIPNLTILGGTTSDSLRLIGEIIGISSAYVDKISRIDSLDFVAEAYIPDQGSVLGLIDLDEPVFSSVTAERINALKQLFSQSKSVLWITRGSRDDNPWSNMTVGLGRTLLLELPHLSLQFLDLGRTSKGDARTITEALLRFEAANAWANNGGDLGALWSVEPEIAFDQGTELIPRLKLDSQRNARYNSRKRPITKEIFSKGSTLDVVLERNQFLLRELPVWVQKLSASRSSDGEDIVPVEVISSTLQAVRISPGLYAYVVLGYHPSIGHLVTTSTHQASRLQVPRAQIFPLMVQSSGGELDKLWLLVHRILAETLLADVPNGGTVLVLDASGELTDSLYLAAAGTDAHLLCLTSDPNKGAPWIYIHPQSPARNIQSILPDNVYSLVDFSAAESLSRRISKLVGSYARRESFATLLSYTPQLGPTGTRHGLGLLLDKLPERLEPFTLLSEASQVVSLDSFPLQTSDTSQLKLIDWRSSRHTSVAVEPVDSRDLFRSDRTYWLVGLTGGLGQSLCSWMVQHGARYVVLSSRNPKVEDRWVASLASKGAVVKILSNDITDFSSVKSAYEEVITTLPPLGGIAQGAMVLQDSLFTDVTVEKVKRVLMPKVDGSAYLDKLLGDTPLDFFVFFSSMAAVTGNGGQAHYAAANMFMSALAANRRKRGLAASVINIGAIVGNGYVTRELTQAQQLSLRSYGNVWMSEQDFHQIFAEAVVSSPPDSQLGFEIMTGLRLVDGNGEDRTTWFENPKFQHLILHEGGTLAAGGTNSTVSAPVKVLLHDATTHEAVADSLRVSFLAKLCVMLQFSPEEAQQRFTTLDHSADDLGIDSLVAVEIRTWFLKELSVDVPVLKILGGSTLGELLDLALEKLPAALVPNLGAEIDLAVATAKINEERPLFNSSSISDGEKITIEAPEPVPPLREEAPPPLIPAVDVNIVLPSVEAHAVTTYSSESVSRRADSPFQMIETPAESWDPVSESELEGVAPAAEIQRTLKASFGQSRFWFLNEYLRDKTTFNITCSIDLSGKLDISALKGAVRLLGERHQALRTAFSLDADQQPQQHILSHSSLVLETRDISSEEDIHAEFETLRNHVYDLEKGKLIRIRLLSLASSRHHLLVGYHHINMDGISLEIILGDIQRAYDGDQPLDPVLQYGDYSARQHKEHKRGEYKEDLAFWRNEFSTLPDPIPILPVSSKLSRPPIIGYRFQRVDLRLDEELATRIQSVSRKLKSTAFHFYLAALDVLLFRYTGVDDLSIGIADGNRTDADTQNSVGFYLNLLAVRFRPTSTQTFAHALNEAKKKAYMALSHGRAPIDLVLSELSAPRSAAYSPLFQVFLNFRQGVEQNRRFCGCDTDGLKFESGRTGYDINVDIVHSLEERPLIAFNVQDGLYTRGDAGILLRSYIELLDGFSRHPEDLITQSPLHPAGQVQNAVNLGRGKILDSEWGDTLVHRFDQIAQQYSAKPAVTDAFGSKWSYQKLARRTHSISAALLEAGVTNGSSVAVFQEPSSFWLASLLAIWRVGATYVALDPRIPVARLATIVGDSRARVILTHDSTTALIPDFQLPPGTRVIDVQGVPPLTGKSISNHADKELVAALIYTSGSTGLPKGIQVTHGGLLQQMAASSRVFGLDGDIVLQHGAVSFDISLWQTFFAIANGGSLVIASSATRQDASALIDLILSERVNVVAATPSQLTTWLRLDTSRRLRQSKLTTVVAGGEKVPHQLLGAFQDLDRAGLKLFNAYGPSEISICSHAGELDYRRAPSGPETESMIPAGQTLPNYSVYIVDSTNSLSPVGVSGEIVLGGAGVALGYSNNQALTEEKFIHDNHASAEYVARGWTRAHRTGDRGRLLDDGRLVVEGRIDGDNQIKLRGVRIDLGDIETAIITSAKGSLSHAVVTLRTPQNKDAAFLVAHVVLAASATGDGQFLETLRSNLPLPTYMIPSRIIAIKELPLTSSGKLSRRAVSEFPLSDVPTPTISTTLTPAQTQIKGAWTAVLSEDVVSQFALSADTDFFHVGGNSLLVLQLQRQIEKQVGILIPLPILFESSTLGGMATRIKTDQTEPSHGPLLDWEQETQLSAEIAALGEKARQAHRQINTVRVVALTGATGFLGKTILDQLLEDRNIDKVYCLAVRSGRGAALPRSPKIEIHEGDLSLPALGLDNATAARLFKDTDAIIHNGADVSFLKTYHSLKPTNVGSTKELLRLALQFPPKSFHYISTAGVAQLSGQETFGAVSIGPYPPPADGSVGYISSKWVSERLLEKASRDYGLPVIIHRPSNITGENAPSLDIMTNLLKFSRSLALVPQFKSLDGYVNFVPVETVAYNVVQALLANSNASIDAEPVFVYQIGRLDIPLARMKEHLEQEDGRRFAARPLPEWVGRARTAGLDEMVASYLLAVDEADQRIVLPRLQ
ncbi:putative hybrid NRPS/PKS enzyme [Penicillium brasilianum]|uniref:Putative hybrid NRPS/PKS enzyme n=1 Tax=Penicillium brasilianum TaxID=104259 RepID=A0A1S9RZ94_PENBI|nr:putative hybrid NRPS/PKS enzyme [Penicillium brasilianum]